MERLKNYLQDILFSRVIKRADYAATRYGGSVPKDRSGITSRVACTEYFDGFWISYDYRIDMITINEKNFISKIQFENILIMAPGGLEICKLEDFARFYEI